MCKCILMLTKSNLTQVIRGDQGKKCRIKQMTSNISWSWLMKFQCFWIQHSENKPFCLSSASRRWLTLYGYYELVNQCALIVLFTHVVYINLLWELGTKRCHIVSIVKTWAMDRFFQWYFVFPWNCNWLLCVFHVVVNSPFKYLSAI